MSETVCRLSVRSEGEHTSATTDLVLPAGVAVDSLVPDIVALTHPLGSPHGVSWCLDRTAGEPINGSLSLRQNGVHDGDVLQLSHSTTPELGARRRHPTAMAADRAAPDPTGHLVAPVLGLWAVIVASVMLLWSAGHGDHITAAAISCGGVLAALTMSWRSARAEWPVVAVTLAFTAGFSAVPGGPAAPNVLLGSAAVFAVALVLLRVGADRISVAVASLSALLALAAAMASTWSIPPTSTGVAVASAALVELSVAPRCAITVAGLTPRSATLADGDAARVEQAHRMLTATVVGAAAAAAVGVVFVAVAAVEQFGTATLVFSWVLAATVALRAPSYRQPVRRWSVLIAGMVCVTAALAVTATMFPGRVAWLGGGVIAMVLGAQRVGRVSATAAQRLVYLEYAALVALPLCALWAADVFGLVRAG